MHTNRRQSLGFVHVGGLFCVFAMLSTPASAAVGDVPSGNELLAIVLAATGIVVGVVSLIIAFRVQGLATSALQEAGEARARAQSAGQGVSADALAATERVWFTRFSALEAQMHNGQPRNGRSGAPMDRQMASDLGSRIEDVEKTLAGLSALVTQSRRAGSTAPATQLAPELPWPFVLKTEKQGFKELRDLLQEGSKVSAQELEILFQELNTAEKWSQQRRPSLEEVLSFLQNTSQAFHTLLRKGASQPAHEGSRMADRLLGVLRPVWQAYHPGVDCRIFYPGTPFDPEWMEDQNPAAARRPTISEMFSWAIHEKRTSGRRIIAKARVTTE